MADLEIIGTLNQVTELTRSLNEGKSLFMSDEPMTKDGKFRWRLAKVDNQVSKYEKAAKCETCRWYWEVHKTDGYSFGECRFTAPVVGGGSQAHWPALGSGHFCGQHEAIE